MTLKSKVSGLQPRTKASIVIVSLIVAGIVFGYAISQVSLNILLDQINNLPVQIDDSRISRSVEYYSAAIIALTIELVLLLGVLLIYIDSYRKTESRFLLVLNLFIMALVVKAVLAIVSLHTVAADYIQVFPYVSRTFLTPGFGELSFILTGFEIIAMSILVYLSME